MVPPARTIASDAAALAVRHCSIGLPRWAATTVKYSDAPVGYTCEMWQSTSADVPDSVSAPVSASVTAVLSAGMFDHVVAVSSVSHSAPADSSASRRYGAPNRPCSHTLAGSSPSEVPPCCSRRARVSACRLSACAAVPSNTVTARQPPVMVCSLMASVVARLTPVSASSDSRITVGPLPVCVTARKAIAPVPKSGNDHAS